QGLSRISGGLEGYETGTRIHGSDGCLLHGTLALRLPERVPGPRAAWGCNSDPFGTLSWRPSTLRQSGRVGDGESVRWHLLSDAERHGREADSNQKRRRWRGDLRRRWLPDLLQPHGGEL